MNGKTSFLRNFLIGVGLAGGSCLAVGIWLHGKWALNPLSEIVEINGTRVEINWTPAEWEPGLSGVWSNNTAIESAGGWDGRGNVPVKQWLVTISYVDHFGDTTFKSQAGLWGTTTEDWSSYVLHPTILGGGVTDGATHFLYEYQANVGELTLTMTQYLNSSRIAKTGKIKFARIKGVFRPILPINDVESAAATRSCETNGLTGNVAVTG